MAEVTHLCLFVCVRFAIFNVDFFLLEKCSISVDLRWGKFLKAKYLSVEVQEPASQKESCTDQKTPILEGFLRYFQIKQWPAASIIVFK